MTLNQQQESLCTQSQWDFSDLKALFLNCTLKKSPEPSHTQGLIEISKAILQKNGVTVDELRPVDYQIATGVWPDMREHGWDFDDWPEISNRVMAADILVIGTSIWLGEKTSVATQVIERALRDQPFAERTRPIRLLRSGRRVLDHGQRGWSQTLRDEHPLFTATSRIRHPAPGRCSLAGRGRARSFLSRPRLRWAGE